MLARNLIPAFLLALATGLTAATLPDFSKPATLQQAQAKGSELTLVTNDQAPVVRVEAGLKHKWPGPTFSYPAGLDLSKHGVLVVPLRNLSKETLRIYLRIDSRSKKSAPEKKALESTWNLELGGGQSGDLRIPLIPHFDHHGIKKEDFFGMRGIPFFGARSMHLGNIISLIFFVTNLEKPVVYEIGQPRLEGTPNLGEPVPENPFPLIDQFGQFKHRDWPGKTHSVEQMRQRRNEEKALLASVSPPASWNKYGGWKDGPQLEASGWFRTAKHNGKWHFVDPDGRLFFSLGIDCVGYGNHTVLDERRHWFDGLPADDNRHAPFYGRGTSHMPKYHFFNKQFRTFNHHKYNVMRKYGGDFERAFAEASAARLPAWGVNTIANWSKAYVYSLSKVPYVVSLGTKAPPIEGSSGYWGQFVDPFHPDFKQKLRQRLKWKEIAATRDDPMCIGYFVDNELSWGNAPSLATATLSSPAGQNAKQVFVAELKTKYKTIAALNQSWKTEHTSWDALLASTEAPELDHARADLDAFYDRIADTYFRGIREVLKEFAPHHLYLGCRFAWGNTIATTAATRHCDVISFNAYTRHLEKKLPFMEEAGDLPYIIGEFHYGALDRGMLHTGLIPVADQAERAQAFTDYVSDCLAHPNIVGCHWFQYTDSPTTGRSFDGENYQIGFTDVCDTPYPELIKASRAIGEQLYQKRSREQGRGGT